MYEQSRGILKNLLESTLRNSITSAEHARRKVVTAPDVCRGLDGMLHTSDGGGDSEPKVYGFGQPGIPAGLWSNSVWKVLKQVHPDTGINAGALAAADDYVSDLMQRVLNVAAKLPLEKLDEEEGDYVMMLSPIGEVLRAMSEEETSLAEKAGTVPLIAVGESGPQIAVDADDAQGHEEPLGGVKALDSRAIQTAVRLVLPGELAKHAVSEGTKAV